MIPVLILLVAALLGFVLCMIYATQSNGRNGGTAVVGLVVCAVVVGGCLEKLLP